MAGRKKRTYKELEQEVIELYEDLDHTNKLISMLEREVVRLKSRLSEFVLEDEYGCS